jgi:hypothetical protein
MDPDGEEKEGKWCGRNEFAFPVPVSERKYQKWRYYIDCLTDDLLNLVPYTEDFRLNMQNNNINDNSLRTDPNE